MTLSHRRCNICIRITFAIFFECFNFENRLIFLKNHLEDCLESLVKSITKPIENLWLILKLKVDIFELVFIKSELEKKRVLHLQIVYFLY